MQELTFRGFLYEYIKALSLGGTRNIRKLVAEAAGENIRLREPLLLYALFAGKQQLLLKAVRCTKLEAEFGDLLSRYDVDAMRVLLENESTVLPLEYHKVWRSYCCKKNERASLAHSKELVRQKVLRLKEKTGATNYRICKDLELNPGNFNRWLRHGEFRVMSIEKARAVVDYLRELQQGSDGNEENED